MKLNSFLHFLPAIITAIQKGRDEVKVVLEDKMAEEQNVQLGTHFLVTAVCCVLHRYAGPNEQKDAKVTVHSKWVLIVTELFKIAVNDFDGSL